MNITTTTMPFAQLKLEDGEFKNPRTSSGLGELEIRELALHIGRHGVLVPLIVRPTGLIASGQRRYRAIGWLLRWFIPSMGNEDPSRFYKPDDGVTEMMREIEPEEFDRIVARARDLRDHVPVRVVPQDATSDEIDAIAIADNLLRSDLSTFEVAKHLWGMHVRGMTGADISRAIGKSTSYVSRKLSAWKGAGAELRDAWERNVVTEDVVQELAKFSYAQQTYELAAESAGESSRGKRGPANRPGIDTVKDILFDLEQHELAAQQLPLSNRAEWSCGYEQGAIDALRWVTGGKVPTEFLALVNNKDEP